MKRLGHPAELASTYVMLAEPISSTFQAPLLR